MKSREKTYFCSFVSCHALGPNPRGPKASSTTFIIATTFSSSQLSRIDEALTRTSADTGLLFSVWVGELGGRSRERAEELHAALGDQAEEAVLIAVSPGERVVEVVRARR